jgi:UDP-glucose 4-epimerase
MVLGADFPTGFPDPPRVVITGAAGFLGRELVRQALAAGWWVRATDRHRGPLPAAIDFWPADIRRPATLDGVFDTTAAVIHAAGLAHVFDPLAAVPFHEVNAVGTSHVVEAAIRSGVRRMVLLSSVAVFGRVDGPCTEDSPCRPATPYAQSKLEAEQRASEAARAAGMDLVVLRLATLYGEEDPGNVARLMRAIDRGRFIWIGRGENRKSLLYRGDAARACLTALGLGRKGVGTYNVSAPACTVREVVETLACALGRRTPRWHIPARWACGLARAASRVPLARARATGLAATLSKWLADDVYPSERFARAFGFRAEVALGDGLWREVAWYRQGESTHLAPAGTPLPKKRTDPVAVAGQS